MQAIILAGGKGTRLKPYTTLIPKPLVPIGGEMPIMEIIIRQLSHFGFDRITISLNHLSHLIRAFFADGSRWNVKIDYSIEEIPLSTIAPLGLIKDLSEDFLVVNGDVLCDINYAEFFNYHLAKKNKVTVATFKRNAQIDFGVLEYDKDRAITAFREKPTYHFDVSMGVYCINRCIIDTIPKNQKYGFDNLMIDGIRQNARYGVFPFDGFWLDIGRPDDYDYCNENYAEIKNKLKI